MQKHSRTKKQWHSPVNSPKKRLQTRRSRGLMLSLTPLWSDECRAHPRHEAETYPHPPPPTDKPQLQSLDMHACLTAYIFLNECKYCPS